MAQIETPDQSSVESASRLTGTAGGTATGSAATGGVPAGDAPAGGDGSITVDAVGRSLAPRSFAGSGPLAAGPAGGADRPKRNWALIATRAVLVTAGVVMLAIGAASALRQSDAAVTAVPLVAGFLLVLTPFMLDRIEERRSAEQELPLRLTRTVRDLGAVRTARILESTDLVRFADSYGFISHVLDGPQYRSAKVHLQDTLISRAAEIAMTSSFDPGEVRKLFRDGPPVVRALALGLMDGDLALADSESVLSAIADSRSANEQLHGLQLASRTWHKLSPEQRRSIVNHVKSDPRITAHSDRARLAEELQQRG